MEKVKVSQDYLYEFLKEHNMTIAMIAKKMGASESIVRNSLQRNPNRHGNAMSLSAANIERLNAALEEIAGELRESVVAFGSDQMFTNQRGTTYDPGTLPGLQRVGEYFNMKALTERLLGWNKTKRDITLSVKSSPMYGRVTQADVNLINTELLAVAGVLSSYQVVADEAPKEEAK